MWMLNKNGTVNCKSMQQKHRKWSLDIKIINKQNQQHRNEVPIPIQYGSTRMRMRKMGQREMA